MIRIFGYATVFIAPISHAVFCALPTTVAGVRSTLNITAVEYYYVLMKEIANWTNSDLNIHVIF